MRDPFGVCMMGWMAKEVSNSLQAFGHGLMTSHVVMEFCIGSAMDYPAVCHFSLFFLQDREHEVRMSVACIQHGRE